MMTLFFLRHVDGSESKATVQYIALFSNILHRARYNKFAKVVNEELGSQVLIPSSFLNTV